MAKKVGSNLGALRAETVGRLSKKAEPAEAPSRDAVQKADPAPHRVGKVALTAYFPPQVRKQLKMLAVELDQDMDDCLAEALNYLFAAHGKPEIAPRKVRGQ